MLANVQKIADTVKEVAVGATSPEQFTLKDKHYLFSVDYRPTDKVDVYMYRLTFNGHTVSVTLRAMNGPFLPVNFKLTVGTNVYRVLPSGDQIELQDFNYPTKAQMEAVLSDILSTLKQMTFAYQ